MELGPTGLGEMYRCEYWHSLEQLISPTLRVESQKQPQREEVGNGIHIDHYPGSGHPPKLLCQPGMSQAPQGYLEHFKKVLQSTAVSGAWSPGQEPLCLSLGSLLLSEDIHSSCGFRGLQVKQEDSVTTQ